MQSVSDWQNPFVDVFKRYNTFEAPKSYKGSVNIVHDPIIARKTFKLSGSILSNNTVTIPDPNSQIKTANLIGRYIYLEFMASPQKYFCVHFQIGIKDRQPGVRFTFTNMQKEYSVTGGNTLKIPFLSNQRNLWTIACIDIEHHLENFGLFSKGVIKNYSGVHLLKGIQLCSNITVRGVYTSSNVYDWDSLPKQMSFKMIKGGRWEDSYNFTYLPNSINPAQIKKKLKQEGSSNKQFPHSIVQRQEASTTRKKKIDNVSITSQQIKQPSYGALPSQPFLQLTNAFSFSSLYNPDMIFQNDKIYYSAGGILVCKDINTGEQKFMQGHTDYIVAMDYHEDWIVTVQEGSKSSVRIWIDQKCICSFQCPYQKVQQIRISHKKHLAMVGLDPYKRQAILIFDISQIQTTRKPVLIAKQISDFNILTLKFSPVDTQKLVSCGKQNIRFWRTKNQHLPGSPVILNQHARNTIFTVFDFEYHFDDPNPLKQRSQIKRVYVGTQTGLLFQVNYNTHELQEVYKLHDNSAISSVCIGPKFCVTGGQDQLLRVWQMDFSQFTLQAANDGVVTSLVLSEDATQVACGTSTGTLSILQLTTNNCKTIVRSHTQPVTQIVFHQFSNSMITLSNDLTIRLWDVDKLQQTYEFSYPSNDACLCLSGCPNGMYFAAGFKSGVLRIFDIEKITVIEEIKHHENPILHVQYSPDGRFLAVLEDKLNMLYSPMHSHQPVKHLPVQIPSKYKHSSFSDDSQFIALIGDSGTHINIWALKTLQMVGKIFTGKIIKKLKYHENTIWTMFEDTSIRRYNIQKMTIEVEMQALHRQSLNDIDFDVQSHLLFTVGDDSFVKVWDYSFLREPHQVFIGHANKINGVAFRNNKLWTIGSQGVLVWDFKPSQQKFVPPPIFAKQKKAAFINNPHTIQNTSILNESNQNIHSKNPQRIEELNQLQEIQERPPQKIKFSNVMKKNGQNQSSNKFVPQKIDMTFQQKQISFRKNKKRQGKPQLTSQLPIENKKNLLPLRHYYQQSLKDTQIQYPRKIEMIKENNKKYKLQYIVGLQPTTHDHVVWNFMYGWYAYIYDNLVIIESLNKSRSQRVVTLPEKLASLSITKDFKKLLCSSAFNATKKQRPDLSSSDVGSQASGQSAGQNQQSNTANIYVLGLDFTIEKKLQFHPRGVQSFKLNDNNKFLVSIGNFRECTVCVWDYQFGKLKASNYTLDKLNDIAIMKGTQEGRQLEFATVGRDQIHFWAFTKDQKLQYYDIFIKSQDQQDEGVVELTSCDYLQYEEAQYLFCGTTKGQLVIVRYGDFKVVWRKNVCSSQIMNIKCLKNRTVLGCADGNVYFWNHDTNILQSQPNPSFVRMNLYYSINGLYLDEQGNEGIVSTAEAIYYVNLQEQFHSILAGSSPSPVIMTKSLSNNQFMLTSHQSGRLKLWNVDTAQQLKTYKWKYPCTQAYYEDSISKVVCFCQNQSVKLVNIKKFTKQQNYLPEQLGKVDTKTDDYVIYSSQVLFGNRPSRWIFYKKGGVYSFQICQQGKKKAIKAQKVLELGYTLQEVFVYPQKNLFIAVSNLGVVSAYNVDQHNDGQYSLLIVDKALPQQFSLQKKGIISQVEGSFQQQRRVRIAVSKVLNQTYIAIADDSQYIYFRNYMKRITFQKISLGSIPRSLYLLESRKQSEVIVGLKEGGIMTINSIDPEQRIRYEGLVNDSIDSMFFVKGKNWLVAQHPTAMTFYSMQ